jgi:outer membrane immunogenic protein
LRSFRVFAFAAFVAAIAILCSGGSAVAGINFITVTTITQNPAPFGSNNANAASWLAGGHAGYNWQQGGVVFGFETDLQGTHLNSAMTGGLQFNPPTPPFPDAFASTSALIDWYGTFRGRLGFTMGQWLFYGTGGLAYGDVSLNSTFNSLGLINIAQTSGTKTGYVGGFGVEYLFKPNLSFTLIYEYIDLGRLNLANTVTNFTSGNTLSQTASTHAQFQTVMLGISWHFAPTGGASPWSGGYVGGQAGGAWGLPTSAGYGSTAAPTVSVTQVGGPGPPH